MYYSILWSESCISDLEQRIFLSVNLCILGCCAETVELMKVTLSLMTALKVAFTENYPLNFGTGDMRESVRKDFKNSRVVSILVAFELLIFFVEIQLQTP